ncbi:FAR11/STRIP family protein [Aspergillus undulatus]|uniref:FAR11/STRIP family protein n=1 Tax=Aspergillus undulatus TaxID=1810928 RepID=UPI003CCE0F4D
MDEKPTDVDAPTEEHHIVKADEVDQTGTDISPVPDDQMMEEVAEGIRQEQAAQNAQGQAGEPPAKATNAPKRPELLRNSAAPPPPRQPPPPAPVQQSMETPTGTDSLSLAQLRQLVQEMPKSEQPAYAFEYADTQSFHEEIEEWFQYSEFDRAMVLGMKSSFEQAWSSLCGNEASQASWVDDSDTTRKSFLTEVLDNLGDNEISSRIEALESVCYVLTGVWSITAGKSAPDHTEGSPVPGAEKEKSRSLQIAWMKENARLVHECSGIQSLYGCLLRAFEKFRVSAPSELNIATPESTNPALLAAAEREANLVLTAFYLVVEVARKQEAENPGSTPLKDAIVALEPDLMVFLIEIIARLRWDDSSNVPLTRIILLFWKCILLFFGGSDSLKQTKDALEPAFEGGKNDPNRRTPFLTASPLDYHSFRQEITSKYPAYNPPPSVIPLELENNSILPPLPQNSNRNYSSNGLFSGVGPSVAGGNGSILHQSVHIATPAPSPPPSPIGPGGKAAKKQNYQTNQNFPFMYPPLDNTSNELGGKGTTEMQDVLVGKKWEGSDVPASVIEAGKLFSTHVKMTRAMRQMWEEREQFMKYDRGWHADAGDEIAEKLEDFSLQDGQRKADVPKERQTDDDEIQKRLDAVEAFYTHALVHLQSIVIVFLKIVLTNVSALVNSQANGQNGSAGSESFSAVNGAAPSFNNDPEDFNCDATIDELDNIRLREITGKAISGSLLLLLKWFKRSHILKFEYMTQLLLDSNYLPLILKMFAHQEIDQAVAQRTDRDELGFFHFCHLHSEQPPDITPGSDSDDDAVPPPIARHRTEAARADSIDETRQSFATEGLHRPEVDELGYPTAPPPSEPITDFSFRNFFSAINYLHIMQKITRDKAHRCLLLVQYKSSTILRKGLKIPDPHLRFYTLKLFKSQVPYCGRKWRQGNMRVITAIYLYCRPELRDDWLAGSDIDAEVEEALPLEQALRGLTHWWHLRQYKHVMGGDEGATIMDDERDFFVRELEAMGWGYAGDELLNGMAEEELAGPLPNGTEWDGMLQMEGA